VGNDTSSAILSGVVNGALAEVRELVASYRKSYPRLKVLITGGDAEGLAERLKINIFAAPDLVLYGLYEIHRYHDATR
jgi:type III pantothenate kinase